MLIFIVFLVSVNILMVKTENNSLRVSIKQGTLGSCLVPEKVALTVGINFILEVVSDFFIMESIWEIGTPPNQRRFVLEKEKEVYNVSITYSNRTRTVESNATVYFEYKYLHTRVFNEISEGDWLFQFKYLLDFNPWSLNYTNNKLCSCQTKFQVKDSNTKRVLDKKESDTSRAIKGDQGGHGDQIWVYVVASLLAVFLVLQSSYMIYGKVRRHRANRNNDEDPISPKSPKGKRSKPRTNIAERPPLPLPPDDDIQTPPGPPVSPGPVHKHHSPPGPPISPGPVHKHHFPTAPPMSPENSYNSVPIPLVSKPSHRNRGLNTPDERVMGPGFDRRPSVPFVPGQSYRNKALVTSVEELRTPPPRRHMDVPFVPKQAFKNKALVTSAEELRTPVFPRSHMDGPIVPKKPYGNSSPNDSDEEHMTPGFARRQIETKFAQIPPKGVAPSKSFKVPKPFPRSPPSPSLEREPPFNPAHRTEPVPHLHSKKLPVFPPGAPFRKPDPSYRMSDDDWQYEQLQPASKYLNNLPTTNNYNI